MKITINTNVLSKHNLSLGEFLILLMGYFEIDYMKTFNSLLEKGHIQKNVFTKTDAVLSDKTKEWIASLIMESDDKAFQSNIDFNGLANKLRAFYPKGYKRGTTHSWQDNEAVIAQKLRVLIVRYGYTFTEEEAISAVKQYVDSFVPPYTDMHLLRNFLLHTRKDSTGKLEIESLFMSIIENNREQ